MPNAVPCDARPRARALGGVADPAKQGRAVRPWAAFNLLTVALVCLSLVRTPTTPASQDTVSSNDITGSEVHVIPVVEVSVMALIASAPLEPSPATDAPATEPAVASGTCADVLEWVGDAGVRLPPGVGYHCPSTEIAHHGAACWAGPFCPDGPFVAINLDLMAGRSTAYLRHVVAHELCHMLDFAATGSTTESAADACAAAHGAPA